jgi:hexosaminidase
LYFDYYQSNLPDEWQGQPPMTTLRQAYDTELVPNGATAAQAKRIIGVQGNLWSELMPRFANVQHALFPRIAALSEVGWSAASVHDWNGFLQRLPAELARYRALGIGYADTAFAPALGVTAGRNGMLQVALSNQVSFGEIRYTTNGSAPTSNSTLYAHPLDFSAQRKVTLRAATFAPRGFDLSAPRTRVLDASTLLTRNDSQLESCSDRPQMRLAGNLPAQGPRPVYKLSVGDMCWLWRSAPLQGIEHITLNVGHVAWRFGDDARDAVVRAKAGEASSAGAVSAAARASAPSEFEIHADSCSGPLLARSPLTPATLTGGQHELNAEISASQTNDAHDLCIFATGDPREGQWALARVALSK